MFATASSGNIFPFRPLALPDIFLAPVRVGAAANTDPIGLDVKMVHRPCRSCGGSHFIIGPGKGPHLASIKCIECNHHGGWLSRGAVTFLKMTISKFGRPIEPIAVRNNFYDEDF